MLAKSLDEFLKAIPEENSRTNPRRVCWINFQGIPVGLYEKKITNEFHKLFADEFLRI